LVQQEPDASFPNGGIRNTFEAEDILTWDLLYRHILYVSYRFISYTGEALDNKIPLLRALSAMDTAATEVCKYFDKMLKGYTTLGWNKNIFLINH
jgi:glutamine synthetase